MSKKTDDAPFNLVLRTFGGKRVQLVTKERREATINEITHYTQVGYEGYLMDADDKYFFLSPDMEYISHAIKIDDVFTIVDLDVLDASEAIEEERHLMDSLMAQKPPKEELN